MAMIFGRMSRRAQVNESRSPSPPSLTREVEIETILLITPFFLADDFSHAIHRIGYHLDKQSEVQRLEMNRSAGFIRSPYAWKG